GQLGDSTRRNARAPVQVGFDDDWTAVMASHEGYSAGLKQDGTLWAWGSNFSGQLGNATMIDQTAPIQVGSDNDWVQVAVGAAHTIAVKQNGTIWSWGLNSSGQLGNGATGTNTVHPEQVGSETNWVAAA